MKSLKDGRFEMNMSKRLGSGNFADVYLATDKMTGQEVAIKAIAMNKIAQYGDKLQRAIEKEIYVLKKLTQYDNPYLLRFIDCFDTPNNKYLVMEFCNGGTLGEVLKKMRTIPERQALEYAAQMVLGLSALEESGMSHRDLKPDNVFLHNNTCKIGDFGFASHESKFTSSLGTCVYMAPEFYVGDGQMNSKVDVWAFGVTLFQLIYNSFPFDGRSSAEVVSAVVSKQVSFPANPQVSPQTLDLLKRCLEKKPDQRISFRELRTHPALAQLMPDARKQLGADVEQSFFYGAQAGGISPQNVYIALRQEIDAQEKKEQPPVQKEKVTQAKINFITKTLIDYRNAYMYFVEAAGRLEDTKLPETDICRFFIIKRALQRASILLFYIKDELQPAGYLLHDTDADEWKGYTESSDFENILSYIIYDVIDLRSLFEQKFGILKELYWGVDPNYAKLINDNLEQDLRESVNMFIKDSILRLLRNSDPASVDAGLMLLILNEVDDKDSTYPYLDDIRAKVRNMLHKSVPEKMQALQQYVSR